MKKRTGKGSESFKRIFQPDNLLLPRKVAKRNEEGTEVFRDLYEAFRKMFPNNSTDDAKRTK